MKKFLFTILVFVFAWLDVNAGCTIAVSGASPGLSTQTVCSGATISDIVYTLGSSASGATFSTTPPSVTGISYDNTTYTISGSTTESFTYTLTVNGCMAGGNPVTATGAITVPSLAAPTPSSQTVCAGGAISAIGTSETGGNGTLSYQWYSNTTSSTTGGTSLGAAHGANTITYSPLASAVVGTTFYYCVMTETGGAGCVDTTPSTASVAIVAVPNLTAPTPSSQTICASGAIGSISTTNSGGTGSVSYQWFSNATNSTTGGTSLGATNGAQTTTYSPPATATVGTTYYYCVMTATGSGCTTATTPIAASVTIPGLTAPTPSSQTVCAGGAISAIGTSETGGNGTLSYQWYSNTSSSTTGGVSLGAADGANTITYSPPASSIVGTTFYYCVMTETGGAGCTVTTPSTASVAIVAVPNLTAPTPSSQTICASGAIGSISTTNSGGTGSVSYQWFSNATNSTTGGTSLGATNGAQTTTYSPPATATVGTTYYYCVMTATGSGCTTATTPSAGSVTIVALPNLTTPTTLSQTICANGPISSLSTTNSGGTGTIGYQWYSNASNSTAGGTSLGAANGAQTTTYSPPPTATVGTTYYYCVMTATGSGCTTATTPATVKVIIVSEPSLTAPTPFGDTVCSLGAIHNLSTTESNGTGTLSYQWYSNTINSTSGGSSLGATNGAQTMTYSPQPTSTVGTTYYYCVLTASGSGCTTATTPSASPVTVVAEPSLTPPSLSAQTICAGSAINSISTTSSGGTGAITYQWYSNTTNSTTGGTSLGATNDAQTTTYSPPTSNVVGTTYYYIIMTANGSGCSNATSPSTASIQIYPIPVLNLLQYDTFCSGVGFSYIPTGTIPANTTYAWLVPLGSGLTGSTIGSGNNISDTLYNSTAFLDTATYTVTPTTTTNGTGCPGQPFALKVTVNPAAIISAPQDISICTDLPFSFPPTGAIPSGTTYSWGLPGLPATGLLGGAAGSGQDSVQGVLTNTDSSFAAVSATATYIVTSTSPPGACHTVFNVSVTVNPDPSNPLISGLDTVCSGTQNSQYLVTNPQPSVTYKWNSSPFLNVNGDTTDIANFSFPDPAPSPPSAVISVKATLPTTGCSVTSQETVAISSNVAPSATVILDSGLVSNYSLICTNNTVDSYQWGYDSIGTLLSGSFQGQTQQALLINQFNTTGNPLLTSLETSVVYYWVEIESGGCVSKIYLSGDAPPETNTLIQDINGENIKMIVYPNPVDDNFNLSVQTDQPHDWNIEVYDISGRKVMSEKATLDKNTTLQVQSSQWSSGTYTLRILSSEGLSAVLVLVKE